MVIAPGGNHLALTDRALSGKAALFQNFAGCLVPDVYVRPDAPQLRIWRSASARIQ